MISPLMKIFISTTSPIRENEKSEMHEIHILHIPFFEIDRIFETVKFPKSIKSLLILVVVVDISGKTIVITVDLLFSAESFNLGFSSWMSMVPAPPADTTNDFRFKVLNSEGA